MKLKILLIFSIVSLYLIITFAFSFIKISNYVSDNNILLDNYILKNTLKKNLNENLNVFMQNNIENITNNFSIQGENFELSGDFSEEFVESIFLKTSNAISSDFSNTKIILYFYNNSKQINLYIEKYFSNLGNYSFENFILDTEIKNKKDTANNTNNLDKSSYSDKEIKQNKLENIIKTFKDIIKKIKSTRYFFFVSPIHFKLSVLHQDLPFTVIFKFNGFYWKVSNIIINYQLNKIFS